MIRLFPAILTAALAAALPAAAQSLSERLSEGAAQAGAAVGNAADKAADVAGKVAGRVKDNVESTVDLATDDETAEETRAKLNAMAAEALARLMEEEPGAAALFDLSAGFAVFDTRQLTVIGVKAGFGRGVAIDKETGDEVYMRMGTGGLEFKFGLGGFASQMVILFQDGWTYQDFITHGLDATASTGAMMGKDAEDATLQFVNGRSVFILTQQGWKVRATLSGTKYWRDAALN